MDKKLYTKEHEWILLEKNNTAIIGITNYAQKQLGDIVFVELPEIGKEFSKGEEIAVVESVKAASEVYSGVSGKIIEVNKNIINKPQVVNEDPEDKGWFVKIEISDLEEIEEFMSLKNYQTFCSDLE
ncbi:MAG: Glycine cleavage system H protein [Alphaproteobacteria bacterium MarineAlpha9_Bin1]|nr:MAG: Glycine cleavage system H protein [Alphaproteobacteria bacterium MarineAlpha9_Bin1]